MFLAEKEQNPKKFGTYADALWWGVVCIMNIYNVVTEVLALYQPSYCSANN